MAAKTQYNSRIVDRGTAMKATITFEFDLPEQESEYNTIYKAQEAMQILYELEQLMRNQLKYGEPAGDRAVLVECRELVNQVF